MSSEDLEKKVAGLEKKLSELNEKYYFSLEKSNARYRLLVENAPYCIHEIDLEGKIVSMNKAGLDILKLKKESEIIGQEYLNYCAIEEKSRLQDLMSKAYEGEASEFEFNSPDGQVFASSFIPISEEGKVVRLMGLSQDITKRKQAEKALYDSLDEKEILLKEIHHRVKNNLQIISSMLNLQAQTIDNSEFKSMVKVSRNRINAMALVHETLFRAGDISRINMHDYIHELSGFLVKSFETQILQENISISADPVILTINIAMPLALILQELVSNALKHAFQSIPIKSRQLDISLYTLNDSTHILEVADNGSGLKGGLDLEKVKTLGLIIVKNLCDQIAADFKYEKIEGKCIFRVKFSA